MSQSRCCRSARAQTQSTYSGTEGGNCVEVATCPSTVHVRDSKVKGGPQLAVPAPSWAAFVTYAAGVS
ncbi:DUF397 domain-containing protein [Streptomyces sp. ISL-100]|uniref:DUF397 domain-containing protein n=1 Tax=Streptomyces sp. ISL-100 TaxID=2819173 RepID=UPI001BE95934|nr:DUF397 domain-containing protein [Streptomyces sp. ISL-100]